MGQKTKQDLSQKDGLDCDLPRRFFKLACAVGDEAPFGIALDGRTLKTPSRKSLALPSKRLAEVVADEWNAQGEHIRAGTMPLNRLANTAQDRVETGIADAAGEIVDYGLNDMLCYRAHGPDGLVDRQREHWQPVLDWAATAMDWQFVCTIGLMPVAQPEETAARLKAHVAGLNAWQLTALHTLTTLSGSAILALAYNAGKVDTDTAWSAANVDEVWQAEHWGEDSEALAARRSRELEFRAAARFLDLL